MNSAQGGSYLAGWFGGQVSGLITGAGLGSSSNLLEKALVKNSPTADTAIKTILGAVGRSVLVGTAGGWGGSVISQLIETGTVNWNEAAQNGLRNGVFSHPSTQPSPLWRKPPNVWNKPTGKAMPTNGQE